MLPIYAVNPKNLQVVFNDEVFFFCPQVFAKYEWIELYIVINVHQAGVFYHVYVIDNDNTIASELWFQVKLAFLWEKEGEGEKKKKNDKKIPKNAIWK